MERVKRRLSRRQRDGAAARRDEPARWDDGAAGSVELRLNLTPEMAAALEAGVPCRAVRVQRVEGDRIALLVWASDREQWLMHLVAHAERAALN